MKRCNNINIGFILNFLYITQIYFINYINDFDIFIYLIYKNLENFIIYFKEFQLLMIIM